MVCTRFKLPTNALTPSATPSTSSIRLSSPSFPQRALAAFDVLGSRVDVGERALEAIAGAISPCSYCLSDFAAFFWLGLVGSHQFADIARRDAHISGFGRPRGRCARVSTFVMMFRIESRFSRTVLFSASVTSARFCRVFLMFVSPCSVPMDSARELTPDVFRDQGDFRIKSSVEVAPRTCLISSPSSNLRLPSVPGAMAK